MTFLDIPTVTICIFEHYLNDTMFLKQLKSQSLAGSHQIEIILLSRKAQQQSSEGHRESAIEV